MAEVESSSRRPGRPGADSVRVERLFSIGHADAAAWSEIEPPDFPFFDFEFLRALECSGSIGEGSGWEPVYLVCKDEKDSGRILGALCLYVKTDSYGEYIFDWGWAHAYEQHGLPYYPKLVAAVPFTPATGPKLLLRPDADRAAVTRSLLDAAQRLGDEIRVSSSHALFLPEEELDEFAGRGFAIRQSLQFQWRNRGYDSFSDYQDAFTSKRRRQIQRERRQLEGEDLFIERLTGEALVDSPAEYAAMMYRFYLATSDRKWGFPYLNGSFFAEVFRTMGDRILLALARDRRTGQPIAGALYFFKGRKLYGRYWGSLEARRNLHFELCYYQGIEFAVERRLKLFESGAQGEHKHARGFLPTLTYSAHEIRHPAFRRAIEQYIAEEKVLLAEAIEEYAHHDPYKT